MAVTHRIIGLMSGSSIDGIDLADCLFTMDQGQWKYQILHARTYPYSLEWKLKLTGAPLLGAREFTSFDVEYGRLLGHVVGEFIAEFNVSAEALSVHGHTVFHQPEKGITYQAGHAPSIYSIVQLPIIYDFRSKDVSLGGQGAPLVPVCDELLFSEYDFCLNLGGFGNISYKHDGLRLAYDICPVNNALNYLAEQEGYLYDEGGNIARTGSIQSGLLKELNNLPFYSKISPKSLGKEWFNAAFLPILKKSDISIPDALCTVVEHIAIQISLVPGLGAESNTLVTGGGAYNDFLLEKLEMTSKCKTTRPSNDLVDFKEAMAFAFLGALRLEGSINIYSSVTGAKRDSCSGAMIA